MLALGIDVAANRALDCVLVSGSPEQPRLEGEPFLCHPADLTAELGRAEPDVVAIDSPPEPGASGSSRRAERDLFRRGIGIFWTPASWDAPFYDWMKVGQETFAAAGGAGYPLFSGGDRVHQRALEVFPHASAVVLRGAVWPAGTHRSSRKKRQWRLAVLAAAGLAASDSLSTLDEVDAALAALTGLYALACRFTAVGDPGEGVIVLPSRELLDRYPREDL